MCSISNILTRHPDVLQAQIQLESNSLVKLPIPAIPSHQRVFGYGEAEEGILFPLSNPVHIYEGTKYNSVYAN